MRASIDVTPLDMAIRFGAANFLLDEYAPILQYLESVGARRADEMEEGFGVGSPQGG